MQVTKEEAIKAGSWEIAPFTIGKYPITNEQYQVFMDSADGHINPQWWDYSIDGKDWRKTLERSTYVFDCADCPRTDVAWFDAVAFCRWLGSKTGLNISLPTEQQWQFSAVGETGWIFPWGNEFDENKCNTRECGIQRISSVTQYPKSASVFGVMDLSGNVWEWCLTKWQSAENNPRFVLNGNSFTCHARRFMA